MPSSKRKARRKPADMNETSEMDMPDSSPTRPSVKKRKVNGGRASTKRRSSVSPVPAQHVDESDEESETVSQSDLIDSVISYLGTSMEPIAATTQYANEKEQPENMQKVSAYAKIAGRDWTYFVREQSVNIGRPPDGGKEANGLSLGASSPIADMKDMLPVHIDLGPNKIVSRHHASIFYDSEYPEGGGWHIRVNGRNGVKVNNILLKRGGRQQIKSGAILEIANTQMMFVTPGDKAQIHPLFIDRAKVMATEGEFGQISHGHPDPAESGGFTGNSFATSGSYQSLAPAPPNFKRAATPPNQQDGRHQRGVFDSKPVQSPIYNRGMMMESTHEIDYARDAAKDLKPPYSYATMIAQAIFSSDEEKLTLSNIYAYISDKYAFYRHSNSGWQNSIRHNLSLNKAFQKVPRRTDEPGKGMKWQIAPEYRQEYWKKQNRRPGNSSTPSSPAGVGKDVNPNFRGPNGQNLGYDTSMVSQFSAKDMSDRPVPPHPARMNFHPFPPPPSQPISGGPPHPASTPPRQRTNTQTTIPEFDDSPLPQHSYNPPPHPTPGNNIPIYTLPSSVPLAQHSPSHHANSNLTLSSSYLDTPFKHNILTPAPLRQNPRLAPPSTLVAPSKFMPESSPAGPGASFWRGAFNLSATPGMPVPDMSPDKMGRDLDSERAVMSSSPPPMDGAMGSPTKSKSFRSSMPPSSSAIKHLSQNQSQNEGKDAPRLNGVVHGNGTASVSVGVSAPGRGATTTKDEEDDDDEGVGGFDLAKGFAPIGSQGFQIAAAGPPSQQQRAQSGFGAARAGL